MTAHPFCRRWARTIAASPRGSTSIIFRPALFRHFARGGARHLRARAADRSVRPAAGRGDLAGHSRIAIAAVGEPGRPQPAVLAAILSAGPGRRFPCAGRRDAGRFLFRHQRRAAVADPRRSRRSDLQSAHPHPLRAGAGAVGRRSCPWPICRPRGTRSIASIWASRRPDDADGVLQDIHWARRADRLLSDLLAGQSVRRAILRRRRSPNWADWTNNSRPANSASCASGWSKKSIPRGSVIRRPTWSSG